jgi:hypothetical protein
MERTDERVAKEQGTFDTRDFANELARAPDNHQVGTDLWFENVHIRLFEVKIEPGERCPFHIHDRTYFWTCIEEGKGLQRNADGTYMAHDYEVGETKYMTLAPDNALIHDLENIGETTLRFVTVELKR